MAAANCSSAMAYVQSTSDNSNLLGEIEKSSSYSAGSSSYREFEKSNRKQENIKGNDGEEIQVSRTLHFKGNERYRMIF